ncbi:MAG TPA: alpha/beta hydrolase [Anaerolineales bacterium]|nr:alpha/beta hydrolase [Anaerolineales bacterium]
MSSTLQVKGERGIKHPVNFVSQGSGWPVIMIHGLAASLHDWDFLFPPLVQGGYAGYALDLLGHGDSPKPDWRAYHIDRLFDHFVEWIDSLALSDPAVLIGHSLGGYIALEYARRFSVRTRGLILVAPFYSCAQLPPLLRLAYRQRLIGTVIANRAPEWLLRFIVDLTSLSMGNGAGGLHALPEEVRAQTALDYTRTAPGVYNLPNTIQDLTPYLPSISIPSLVVWGNRDRTLAPSSFREMLAALPGAKGQSIQAGHVPHQSDPAWFNRVVLTFLGSLRVSKTPSIRPS